MEGVGELIVLFVGYGWRSAPRQLAHKEDKPPTTTKLYFLFLSAHNSNNTKPPIAPHVKAAIDWFWFVCSLSLFLRRQLWGGAHLPRQEKPINFITHSIDLLSLACFLC